jgi:citrate synthase
MSNEPTQIIEIQEEASIQAPPGLKGLIITDTRVGGVRGREGFFHYRQYSAVDLARHRSLEEAWHLLFEGELPSSDELAAFKREIAAQQQIPDALMPLLQELSRLGDPWSPLDALRGALSALGTVQGLQPCFDIDDRQRRRDAMGVSARVASLAAALWRLHRGERPIEPDPDQGYAANYLRMLTGSQPRPEHARALEQYLIATIDHGFNASTFTSRVIASTGADLAACVVGALGAFSGPLHGGSPSRVLDTLDAIEASSGIDDWLRPRIVAGERIMGFGHAVYRTRDPRSQLLSEVAEDLGGERVAFATQVEARVLSLLAELKPGRELHTNVEFYAGVVLEICGIPREMFTPTFASSRVIGWCANILEQLEDPRILRPRARYAGPPAPQPLPEVVTH